MPEIKRKPAVHPRVESGVMQFGDDWPGIFIRGDEAMGRASLLRRISKSLPALEGEALKKFADFLESCRV